LSDDDVVWHRLCEQHLGSRCRKCGWGLPLLDRQRLRQEKRQIQLRAIGAAPEDSPLEKEVPSDTGRDTPELVGQSSAGQKRQRTNDAVDADPSQKRLCTTPSVDGGETLLTRRPWKDVYKARFKVGSNWKHNRHRLQTIKAHSNGVTCLQLGQNILGDHVIASGSYDCSVKLHDVETGQVLKTFEGATQGIRCLQFNQRQLISGSLDGKVRLYDIETGQLKKTLEGPTRGILSVHSDGQWLCAGSMDKNIYVWDASTRRTTLLRG
jgi:F-box/WD-40 domain protein MET30